MIHSMTGFATQMRDLGASSLHLELRSVNSRYLDLSFRIAEDLRQTEPIIRELISAQLKRGKVECRLNIHNNPATSHKLTLNPPLLAQLADAQSAVQHYFPNATALSVGEIMRWPGILVEDSITLEQIQPIVIELANAALNELIATRQREGHKLAEIIQERVVRMRELTVSITPRLPEIIAEYQTKLNTRLRDALATLDDERIRQEIILFAQRIDVAEELSRLQVHLDEVERILKTSGAVGKRLDFLMQELNREANTLASKSSAPDISTVAIELKVLIEQMREQVQNIE